MIMRSPTNHSNISRSLWTLNTFIRPTYRCKPFVLATQAESIVSGAEWWPKCSNIRIKLQDNVYCRVDLGRTDKRGRDEVQNEVPDFLSWVGRLVNNNSPLVQIWSC